MSCIHVYVRHHHRSGSMLNITLDILSLAPPGYEMATSRPALTESSPSTTHSSLTPPQSLIAWFSHWNIVANLPPPYLTSSKNVLFHHSGRLGFTFQVWGLDHCLQPLCGCITPRLPQPSHMPRFLLQQVNNASPRPFYSACGQCSCRFVWP